MPRQNPGAVGFTDGACKIRKRNSSSSSVSTSSSLLQNYRFKRGILVGKRGGSTTPAPNWRMNPKSPSCNSRMSVSSRCNGAQQGPVSARKLANALWELHEMPSSQFVQDLPTRRSKKMLRSLPRRLSDPSHSPVSERSNRSRTSSHRRIMPMVSQRVRCNEHNCRALDLFSNASLMEIDARSQGMTPTSSVIGMTSHLKDLRNGLITSKELLKLLGRIWGLKDQHSHVISLVQALRVELDQAKVQVDHLIQEQRFDHNEINCLKKQLIEEKSLWKSRERERIRAAVYSIMEELDAEKKSRRRAERLNKKLGLELTNTRASLLKAAKEMENERRSREVIEHVCNEIVREVGEDKTEVEQLKQEASMVREELEKEREMLHLADEWREERVQMKLLEAKVQFEEKNAAVDQLRNELEAFLDTKRTKEECQLEEKGNTENEEEEDQDSDDDDRGSADSDLHSIDLNIESSNKGGDFSRRRLSESSKGLVGKKAEELDEDVERYVSVKRLRDQMLAGTRIVLPRGIASPTRQWKRSQPSQEMEDRAGHGLKVAEIVKAVRESSLKVRQVGKQVI